MIGVLVNIFCYQHNIADFRRDTAHLSHEEKGIYRELLDAYYFSGGNLPSDLEKLARIISVHTENERAALAYAVGHFFTTSHGRLKQKRADSEISKIEAKSVAGKQAVSARELKKKGKRPIDRSSTDHLTKNQEPYSNTAPSSESVPADEFKLESEPLKSEKKNGRCGPTELPHGWQPDGESIALATTLGVNLEFALAELRDWAAAKRPKYHDWNATFRNSLRRFAKSGKNGGQRNAGHGREPSGIVAAGLRVAARFEAKEKAGL